MFFLPNAIKIDMDGVIDAMEDCISGTRYFLDTIKGEVGCVQPSDYKTIKRLITNKKYIEIPKIPDSIQLLWMNDFVKTILSEDDPIGKTVRIKLSKILRKNTPHVFDECLVLLGKAGNSLLGSWVQWQDDALFEEMKKWFETLPIKIEQKFEGNCDCELCKLMEKGKHTEGDFLEAMQKQKRKKGPDKNDLYYDAMEAIREGDGHIAVGLLDQALELDEKYVQTHHGLSAVYREMKNKEKYREHTLKAYEETKKIFKKWPIEMEWAELDNRQYLRAIFFRANLHFEDGEHEQGIELYRLLLKMCPNDNLGVRFYLAGIYAGYSFEEIGIMWIKANEEQSWDTMEKMIKVQNKKHQFWKGPKL